MNLGDKIMTLRRQRGWSQEELAERCQVSRQSVSKWESGQSAPDLDKILTLSEIFGVSTDFLLKESVDRDVVTAVEAVMPASVDGGADTGRGDFVQEEVVACSRIGRAEADEFLGHEAYWAPLVALGVSMCILSPVLLILMGGLAEIGVLPVSENLAVGLGIILLLVIVASAVTLFIRYGMLEHEYTSITEGRFELAYGVEAMVRERKKAFLPECTQKVTIGVVMCILAVVPLLAASFLESELLLILAVTLLLCVVAVAVNLFVRSGIVWGSFDRLLKEGDYRPESEKSLADKIGGVYWPLVVAVYLLWSFVSGDWHFTWIVWPVAALVFAAIAGICRLAKRN
ncbi:MAG: helix-turn-helix transcriptional regulator [Firmicutes bacterium]|nr:helix-turn-helix transcriptional regulator [Bacillota bacterium]